MLDFAKWMMVFGFGLLILGGLVWLSSKLDLPFGRLPGDIHLNKDKFSFYFPIVTSIILSIILTVLINLFLFIFKK